MSRNLLKREIGRIRGLRLLVIAVATWLIASALFAPWLNPLLRPSLSRDAETAAIMGMIRTDIVLIRGEVEAYFHRHQQWPASARDLHRPDDNGLLRIDLPVPMQVRFTIGSALPPESGLRNARVHLRYEGRNDWSCLDDPPGLPGRWQLPECRPATAWDGRHWLLAILTASIAVLAVLLALLAFADPRLRAIQRLPATLRQQPIADLPGLHRSLGWLRRRQASLAAARIAHEDWHDALAYSAADGAARIRALALRVSAQSRLCPGWPLPGKVYEWSLPTSFPVALERILVYLPATTLAPRDLIRHLRGVQTGQDVLLVISPDARTDLALAMHAGDPANLCVGLDQSGQSEWLLHPDPQQVLLAVLARQLHVTRLSPYQTRGGITRPTLFFGRESLLARVLNREPGNYLLVGGRQIGKTSLMKAIEHRFSEHPRVHCQYLALRDHRLAERLAAELQLPTDAPLERSVTALTDRADGRRVLLLIDETDLFLRAEAMSGYAQLATLRSLSEEGRCHFMLAGFWDLYQAVSLDYASPIRNFGEVIQLGALEHEACIALATRPLARLGVGYASAHLVDTLVAACGERANLIAIACQFALEQLDRGQRTLDAAIVERSLHSEAMLDALAGWARLSPVPRSSALDRIVVYRLALDTLRTGGDGDPALAAATPVLSLAQVLELLERAGADVTAESLRHSFARLQLAYVLRRSGDGYAFAVPLFVRQFHAGEVQALLRRELESLASTGT